jgi:hypothetical protein
LFLDFAEIAFIFDNRKSKFLATRLLHADENSASTEPLNLANRVVDPWILVITPTGGESSRGEYPVLDALL